jgi:hypothetical protein
LMVGRRNDYLNLEQKLLMKCLGESTFQILFFKFYEDFI